jgi:hypothetical protein
VRLRGLQSLTDDGEGGYAVASAWVAALYVRTERCIAARSRLTHTVLQLGVAQRGHLRSVATFLIRHALPELLHLYAELAALVAHITSDVSVQEISVRDVTQRDVT